MLFLVPLCQRCTTAHGWLGKKMGISEIPSPSWSVLSPFLLQPVFGVSDCEGFCWLCCQLWLSSSPELYLWGSVGGSTEDQGSGWPKPRDVAKDAERGSGRVPKGPFTEVHGALEDKTPEEPPWGVLIMATVIGSLATNVTDISVY